MNVLTRAGFREWQELKQALPHQLAAKRADPETDTF
jgi:hypothetical protein